MSANGKATEPSMDDILASIRRIIAEEPKPGAAPAPRSAEPAPTRFEADALAPSKVAGPTPASTSMPLPTSRPAAAWGSLGAAPAAAPPTAAPAPLAPPASSAPPVPAGTAARPAANGSFGDDLASLIGAVRASANIAGVPASPAAGSPPPPASLPPAMDAAAPRPIAFAAAPHPSAAASPIAAEARARGIEAALFGSASAKQAETTAVPIANGSIPDTAIAPSEADEVKRTPADAAATELVKPAPVLATTSPAKPSTVAPAELATPARPAAVVAVPASSPAAGKVAVARTMEDAVAEMLRPLLRDWLDENMPNIVEKAMKAELADREQRKTGQKPN